LRKTIFDSLQWTAWQKKDIRYQKLDELDRYLDGEIYDDLAYNFFTETLTNGRFVRALERRPSVRFNFFSAFADNVARQLFAGYNAPKLEHKKEKVRKFFEAIKKETKILSHMIEATNWATIGSSAITFKVVPFDNGKKAKVVLKTRKSKDCTPFFNEMDELTKLRVHKVVSGAELITRGYNRDFADKLIKGDRSYWFVRDFAPKVETTYLPIPENKWVPYEVNSDRLVTNDDLQVAHDLEFTPAMWIKRRTGKIREFDGRCVWDQAIPAMLDFDYTMSSTGTGLRYSAAPQVVIKGKIQNADDTGRYVGGPSRYLHFKADRSDPEGGISESGAGAELMEPTGAAMKVTIELYSKMLKEIAMIVICGSRKDPNQITTAMSAKGMEVLDREYNNMLLEFRTTCGDEAYIPLLIMIGHACIDQAHPLAKGLTHEDMDGLTGKWPPLNPIGAQEFLFLCQGAAALLATGAPPADGSVDSTPAKPSKKAKTSKTTKPKPEADDEPMSPAELIMSIKELRSYIMSQIDMTEDFELKDYLMVYSDSDDEKPGEPQALDPEERVKLVEGALADYAEDAIRASKREPIDTTLNVAGV
jgi:hypothetical protein